MLQKNNRFKNEIVPIEIKSKKDSVEFNSDEFPRHGTTFDKINSLKPVFKKEGTVTAGNASGLNDGSAAVLLMKESKANELDLNPWQELCHGQLLVLIHQSWESVQFQPQKKHWKMLIGI